jgi:hypothetical protein
VRTEKIHTAPSSIPCWLACPFQHRRQLSIHLSSVTRGSWALLPVWSEKQGDANLSRYSPLHFSVSSVFLVNLLVARGHFSTVWKNHNSNPTEQIIKKTKFSWRLCSTGKGKC